MFIRERGLNSVVIPQIDQIPKTRRVSKSCPRVAILREQGVNGQIEMAHAFDHCGFEAIDVHMSDLMSGRQTLESFDAMAACGGFSYGDVLGAGSGWARTILFNDQLSAMFQAFFERENTVSLGICNGCQMMAQLAPLIPNAKHFKPMARNASQQFAHISTCNLANKSLSSLEIFKERGSQSLLRTVRVDSNTPPLKSHPSWIRG